MREGTDSIANNSFTRLDKIVIQTRISNYTTCFVLSLAPKGNILATEKNEVVKQKLKHWYLAPGVS